jgi:hypothetical protein
MSFDHSSDMTLSVTSIVANHTTMTGPCGERTFHPRHVEPKISTHLCLGMPSPCVNLSQVISIAYGWHVRYIQGMNHVSGPIDGLRTLLAAVRYNLTIPLRKMALRSNCSSSSRTS